MKRSVRRDFSLFWIGQFVSTAGDHMFYTLLVFLVLMVERTHAGTKAGLVSFLETLPFLLFGPFAGALVDRYPRRAVMIFSDLARMAVLLGYWWLYAEKGLFWWTIGALAFLHTAFSTLFLPARDAFLPLLAEGWLFRANALLQSSTQMAMVVGAFVAGALVGRQNTPVQILRVLTVDAATFMVSALTLWMIRVRERPNPIQRSVWKESVEGFRYVKGDPFLRRLLALTALDNLWIMGPAIVGANLLVQRVYGLGASHLAYFQGMMGVGWLAGTLVLARWPLMRPWKLLVWGIFLDGATYLPFLWIRQYPLALLAILIHGFFIPWITVARTTMVQTVVPEDYRGRVFSFVHLTVLGFTSLSSFLTGVLGDNLPVPMVFFLPGVLGALSGVLGALWLPDPLTRTQKQSG